MTKKHIDGIYEFFSTYTDNQEKIGKTEFVKFTGGEPLLNLETVELINYTVSLWPNMKGYLYTNGINILKYYDKLPFDCMEEVHISLDGTKEIHLNRRYSGQVVEDSIYDDIILGIKRLLNNGVHVKLKTVYDRTTYKECVKFKEFLADEGISDSPHYSHLFNYVADLSNPLNLDINFNDKQDMFDFYDYFLETDITPPNFFSAFRLFSMLGRPKNEPFVPNHKRCGSEFLGKCFFSCDGNVYFCESTPGSKSLGTFYPKISFNTEANNKLLNRSVMMNEKCKECAYKFVCLGGCPKSSEAQGTDMACGIFADEEILDRLEFYY